MEAKETNYKSLVKSNIVLFLSYGILTGFIFLLVVYTIKCALHDISNNFLSITLSLMSSIFLFYLIHFICKSSTLETLKKFNLSKQATTQFLQKMNLFFMICIIISILICIGYLLLDNLMFMKAISQAYEKYEFISSHFADQVANKIREEYQMTLFKKVSCTIITELSLVISFFSLIPYQRKIFHKYNKNAD